MVRLLANVDEAVAQQPPPRRLRERGQRVDLSGNQTAAANSAEALVSADREFGAIRSLRFIELGSPALDRMLAR